MEVIRTADIHIDRPTAVCIGKFDGVHVGHQRLLEHIVAQKARGLTATVFTFNPSAEELFSGNRIVPLCTNDEKESYLEKLGIDIVVEFPLTTESASMLPRQFVTDILIERMNMKYLAAGSDISFGKGGLGDRALIEELSVKLGFQCDIIEKICVDGKEVSSTRVREAVRDGRMEEASRLLGRRML